VLVPVTPHLAEDIWLSLPEQQRAGMDTQAPVSATLLAWPAINQDYVDPKRVQDFEALLALKETVNQALEVPRSEGHIGSSLEAEIVLQPQDDAVRALLAKVSSADLAVLLITSGVRVEEAAPVFDSSQWH